MERFSLPEDAEKLLGQMQITPPREPGERLRHADEAKILELHSQGLSQEKIAAAIGCHQSTVSRTLAEYDDSRPLAQKYLAARALDMTKRFVTDARPEAILRMLAKLDVIRDDGQVGGDGQYSTLVVLGSGGVEISGFEPDDVIYVDRGPFEGDGRLMVMRNCGGGSAVTSYALPCPVSEIPANVKIQPDAIDFIRKMQALPPINVEPGRGDDAAVSRGGPSL